MSLNSTPSAERVHIGIFGKRNAGKSSVINAITDQDLAIVSDVKVLLLTQFQRQWNYYL
ncbi:MAG: GTPase [Paeniclostridium sp.]